MNLEGGSDLGIENASVNNTSVANPDAQAAGIISCVPVARIHCGCGFTSVNP